MARPLTTDSVTARLGCIVVPLFSAKPFTYFHILSRLACLGSGIVSCPLAGDVARGDISVWRQFTSVGRSFTIRNFAPCCANYSEFPEARLRVDSLKDTGRAPSCMDDGTN